MGHAVRDDAGIVCKSAEGLAKMMTVIVTVVEAAGRTVSEKKTATMLLRTPDQTPCTSTLVIEAAGQRCRQTTQFLCLGGLIDASADIMREIKRWVQLAWACYSRFVRELYDMEAVPFALKLRTLKAEVMEPACTGALRGPSARRNSLSCEGHTTGFSYG